MCLRTYLFDDVYQKNCKNGDNQRKKKGERGKERRRER